MVERAREQSAIRKERGKRRTRNDVARPLPRRPHPHPLAPHLSTPSDAASFGVVFVIGAEDRAVEMGVHQCSVKAGRGPLTRYTKPQSRQSSLRCHARKWGHDMPSPCFAVSVTIAEKVPVQVQIA